MVCSEDAGVVDEIRTLPEGVRMHLAHVARNGMCLILSAHRLGGDVERAIFEFETRWKELGL